LVIRLKIKTVDFTYRYEAQDKAASPRPLDSSAALLRLNDRNQALATLLKSLSGESAGAQRIISVDSRDLGVRRGDAGLPEQRPFAAIVGCSDSRMPVERIFNEGPNDLFVVRVAGNNLGTEVVGSLKYAVDHLRGSLKLIVVLGHSGCGAITAAVDVFLNPADYLPFATKHSLRIILEACSWSSKPLQGKFKEPLDRTFRIAPDIDRR
jgi:carbonic anhydrase